MPTENPENTGPNNEFVVHGMSWPDFDDMAAARGSVEVVRRLRRAERSRRLLLLRVLADEFAKAPELFGPLPAPEFAWELLARVEESAPAAFELMLSHPYTGSWAGYTTRLLRRRITGTCPLWIHVGHLHALAASAAIHGALDFEISVPVWNGNTILPTLGFARLPTDSRWSVADVRARQGRVEVSNDAAKVDLPNPRWSDTTDWHGVRQLAVRAQTHTLALRLDDVDPYRGLYEPVEPQRLSDAEAHSWYGLLDETWTLIVRSLPDLASAISGGLDSLVPSPRVPFRMPSASTGEAFGSAILGLPQDAPSMAAMLVHEFQHIRLGGLLHLTLLHDADPRERFYVPWRDDPRPIGGVVQGVYAFFGVTMLWRALAQVEGKERGRRAAFEFAYWRRATWLTLRSLRDDANLTAAGRRFLTGVANQLGQWQNESVPDGVAKAAESAVTDHYLGWRLRYLRPNPEAVAVIADSWLSGCQQPKLTRLDMEKLEKELEPTPVPDGLWSTARVDLIRAVFADMDNNRDHRKGLASWWLSVPDATAADFAYVAERLDDAARGYRADLVSGTDHPSAWVGLGLALSALGTSHAASALLRHPELVRGVYRKIRKSTVEVPLPDDLAAWIG